VDEAVLKENAVFLKNNPKMKIQIEGHCDERGTVSTISLSGKEEPTIRKNILSSSHSFGPYFCDQFWQGETFGQGPS